MQKTEEEGMIEKNPGRMLKLGHKQNETMVAADYCKLKWRTDCRDQETRKVLSPLE